MTQNPNPNPSGIQRGSGRVDPIEGLASIIPFLGFLGFIYIALTMGKPDRMIWEAPATATNGENLKPQCVAANPSPGVYEWRDCTPEELQEGKPQIFNTLTNRWE